MDLAYGPAYEAFRGEVCAWLTQRLKPERVAGREDPTDRTGLSAEFGRELQGKELRLRFRVHRKQRLSGRLRDQFAAAPRGQDGGQFGLTVCLLEVSPTLG